MAAQPSARTRRRTCWWEPTFDPDLVGALAPGSWDFAHNLGPTRFHFEPQGYDEAAVAQRHKFKSITFTDCDFQGFFTHNVQIAFDRCIFINCDFGLSTWTNVKFSGCAFNRCSFGMTVFNNCEFRGCEWSEIGLSPNMLELNGTYIGNPGAFIASAYTNTDEAVLCARNIDGLDQITRLEQTKATISRRILKNLQEEGDDKAFYDAVKTFQLQQSRARRYQAEFDISRSQGIKARAKGVLAFVAWVIEGYFLRAIGQLNGWGASIIRPIIITVFSAMIFSGIYHWICRPSFAARAALQRSFEITILAGYSNYNSESDLLTIIVQNIHLVFSTIMYAVTFSTIVARLSRVR